MPTWGPLMTCAGIWISSHEAFGLGKQFPKSLQTGDTACAGSVGQGIPDFAAVGREPVRSGSENPQIERPPERFMGMLQL
jgi:hypothetical protein